MTTTTKKTAVELSHRVKSILTDNSKLRKLPSGEEIINAGVTLAPSRRSGVTNVCPKATGGCIVGCVLWFAGRTVTKVVRDAAIARTKLWHYYPQVFYSRLRAALRALVKRAAKKGARAFCRLNVASDIDHTHICNEFPSVTFYDYSKMTDRVLSYALGLAPSNYAASLSISEATTWQEAYNCHSLGVNLVVVFDSYYFGPQHRYGVLPESVTFRGPNGQEFICRVIDGDVHDIRTPEFDGCSNCVALRGKGSKASKLKAMSHGFIRHFAGGSRWYVNEYVCSGSVVVELL